MITRRGMIGGLISAVAAPAIVPFESLMRVKLFRPWSPMDIPGLVYWARAEADGTIVVHYKSGNGNDLVGHVVTHPNISEVPNFGCGVPVFQAALYNRTLDETELAALNAYLGRVTGQRS